MKKEFLLDIFDYLQSFADMVIWYVYGDSSFLNGFLVGSA